MKQTRVFLLIIGFVYFGCSQKDTTEKSIKIELQKTTEKKFFIDSTTAPRSLMLQIVDWNGRKSLTFLNTPTNSINIYDYETGEQNSSISFLREGDEGVGNLKGYHIVNESLIYLYNGSKIYESNSSKKIKTSYNVGNEYTGNDANISISTSSPMIVERNKLYFNTVLLGDMKQKPLIEFDKMNRQFKSLYKLSEKFSKGFWGAIHYDIYDLEYNYEAELFIYSFRPDKNIYVTNLENIDKAYYAGSKYIDEIEPLYESIESAEPNPEFSFKKAIQLGSYGGMIYDKFNKLYYRLALLPVSKEDASKPMSEPSARIPKHSYIILNEKFEKVGETLMPRFEHKLNMYFVTKEGLHIARDQTENEDEIVFDIYKAEEIAND